MKINIFGDALGEAGYSQHIRELSLALDKEGADVSIETQAQPGWEQEVSNEKVKELLKKNNSDGINIPIAMPNIWPLLSYRNQPFYGFAIFEGTKAPIQWMLECNKDVVTKVLVPSTHTRDSLINAGVKKSKIEIVPHGVDLSIFKKADKYDPQFNELVKGSEDFTFLFVGGWSKGDKDRKNLPALLRAYSEEFKKGEKVRLIVKLNVAYNDPKTWNLANEVEKLGLKKEFAKFVIITNMVSRDKLNQFYSLADVFVMPTRGEAFCLPSLEAMACGVPNIATNFGGQTDFINEKNGWLIDYDLAPACEDSLLYEEAEWAEIDISKLRKAMRYAYEHPEEVKKKGKQALSDAQNWTWQSSAKKLLKIINNGLQK